MWNWSNSSGGLFLQTGNMSEKAVGYTTIGGDLEGALAVLANVPKTVVMSLLDYLQEQTGYEGIGLVLAKPAGPELAPDQEGEKELMPFPVLDACFHLFAAEKLLPDEVEEALVVMFPDTRRPAPRLGREVHRASSSARSTNGCRRRSRCTSATSTSTASEGGAPRPPGGRRARRPAAGRGPPAPPPGPPPPGASWWTKSRTVVRSGSEPKIVANDEQHRRQDTAVGQNLHVPWAQVARVIPIVERGNAHGLDCHPLDNTNDSTPTSHHYAGRKIEACHRR